MTGILRRHLSDLTATIADLKERVRVAVAGELGRAVGEAVRQVVQAAASGRADLPRPAPPPADRRPPPGRWDDDEDPDDGWGRAHDAWNDDRPDDGGSARAWADRPTAPVRPGGPPSGPPPGRAGVTAAVAAAVYTARWWLARKGTLLAAAGIGLGVGLLGVLGGPVARTAVAVLAAVADLLAATDALGAGAARLDMT